MKRMKSFATAAILSALMSITAFAGEWKQDNVGWWYQNDDGSYLVESFAKTDQGWCYFGPTGYIATGWVEFPQGWLQFSESGLCANPLNELGQLVPSPAEGWVHFSYDSAATLLKWIDAGQAVYYKDLWWTNNPITGEDVQYSHDVSEDKDYVPYQPVSLGAGSY